MPDFITRFVKFINMETVADDESKTLAVLIRSSSLILAVNMTILSLTCVFQGAFGVTFFYLCLTALLCYIFYITYRSGVSKALWFFHFVIILLALAGTCMYSWEAYFHVYIYFIILTIFFYTKMSVKTQGVFVTADLILLFLLYFSRRRVTGSYGTPDYVLILNLLTFAGLTLSVGFSFASKFARAEYKLYQYNIQLKKLAGSDPLTGLMNRRNMLGIIQDILPRMTGGMDMLSVAMGDIDFFKKVNDSRGHDCGDYVLKELSSLFETFMEPKGYAARWGGEEFLFVFVHGNADNAYVELETLRNKIEKMTLKFADHEFKITMTFGLEEHNVNEDIEETIKKADEKLYMGKESGRNKVVY